MEKPLPFAAAKNSNEFWREVIKLLLRELHERQTKHIPVENHQTFYHGKHWTFQREEAPALYIFLTACLLEGQHSVAERCLNLHFASFAERRGKVTRPQT